jgi:hypothetical protein
MLRIIGRLYERDKIKATGNSKTNPASFKGNDAVEKKANKKSITPHKRVSDIAVN